MKAGMMQVPTRIMVMGLNESSVAASFAQKELEKAPR
jgi:hypothetical protein